MAIKTTKERILQAAAEVFSERGFEGTRVEAVAVRAKVNKASLYYHVGDKAALYEAVLTEWVQRVLAELRREAGADLPPEERLAAIPRILERLSRIYPHYPRIMIREIAGGSPRLTPSVTALMAQLLEMEGEILAEGRALGRFREAPLLSVHILLVVSTVVHFASLPLTSSKLGRGGRRFPPPPESPSRTVADLLLHGLCIPAGSGTTPESKPQETKP